MVFLLLGTLAFNHRVGNAKLDRERQVGTVGTGLVPALHGGSDRCQDNGEDEGPGLVPLVRLLAAEDVLVGIVKLGVPLKATRVLPNEGTLAEELLLVRKAILVTEAVDVIEELVLGDTKEGVLNSGMLTLRSLATPLRHTHLAETFSLMLWMCST